MDRIILHSDANCFYASVEMLHRPEYRDRPLAVGGDPLSRHGIVLTANYPAKRKGVKTGMALWQARQVCPEIVFVPPRMDLYLRFSRYMREIYNEYTDRVEPFGCDESWLDITESTHLVGSGLKAAEELNRRIKKELGITVSIGVSFNKIFAKLGSDYKKPDAVTPIGRDNYRNIVWPLPASDLLYVGRSTGRTLSKLGIRTIGELAQTDPGLLRLHLGKMGLILHDFANGMDEAPVRTDGTAAPIKSIGNSVTTPRDLCTEQDVKIILYILSESVASRLRKHGFRGRTIQISIRDRDLCSITRQHKIVHAADTASEIAEEAVSLFNASYDLKRNKPIRSLGVSACDLVERDYAEQTDLFSSEEKREKIRKMETAADEIRRRFGFYAVQRGLMLCDGSLSHVNAEEDHTVHPVGYF